MSAQQSVNPEPVGRKAPTVTPKDFQLQEHAFRRFNAQVPDEFDPQTDLEVSSVWAHVAPKINMGDEIRVMPESMAWRAILLCTFSHRGQVAMKVIDFFEIEKSDMKDEHSLEDYKVHQRGQKKWCVQRVADGVYIQEHCATQAAAHKWLDEHLLALSR